MFNDILYQLKLLSKVQINDKLSVCGEQIEIDVSGPLRPVKRTYYGETRTATIEKLEGLCENIYEFLESSIKKLKENKGRIVETHIQNNTNEQLKQLWLEMSGSIKGLDNLKSTYRGDASIESRIDICMDKIKGYIDDISHNLYKNIGGGVGKENKGNNQK